MIDKNAKGIVMENLIKPVDYARKMGISRQAVYAKIKKGLLPSRNVGGKIYIVLGEEAASASRETDGGPRERRTERLLAAKDETIAVLKETIRDLKETNRMITSTLRSEVELLKEAFGEMKTLYAAQIEHIRRSGDEPIELEEMVREAETEEVAVSDENGEWIELETFLKEQGIKKKKAKEKFFRQVKKLHKNRDASVHRKKKRYYLSAEKAVELLMKLRP